MPTSHRIRNAAIASAVATGLVLVGEARFIRFHPDHFNRG